MKITVLAGGTSTEREVSLVSGMEVYKALKARGHQVVLVDVYLGCPDSAAPDGELSLIQKNKFSVGETIEIMKPDGRNIEACVLSIRDEAGQPMESAPHAAQRIHVRLSAAAEPYDILRRRS